MCFHLVVLFQEIFWMHILSHLMNAYFITNFGLNFYKSLLIVIYIN
jgi:hypothetical protein